MSNVEIYADFFYAKIEIMAENWNIDRLKFFLI